MTRCITDDCIHHRGCNPNGVCTVERVHESIAPGGYRNVFDFPGGYAPCWHPDKMVRKAEQQTLFGGAE